MLHPAMLSNVFISQSYKLAHRDFGDTWNKAGCTEQSSFLLGKMSISGNASFVILESEVHEQEWLYSLLALISALCMCP